MMQESQAQWETQMKKLWPREMRELEEARTTLGESKAWLERLPPSHEQRKGWENAVRDWTQRVEELEDALRNAPLPQPRMPETWPKDQKWRKSGPRTYEASRTRLCETTKYAQRWQQQLWLAVDLDGTLVEDIHKNRPEYPIDYLRDFGRPLPGAAEAMRELMDLGWRVTIFTARFSDLDPADSAELQRNLEQYLGSVDMPFTDIWTEKGKPKATVIVDDRAVAFDGNWPSTLQMLVAFDEPTDADLAAEREDALAPPPSEPDQDGDTEDDLNMHGGVAVPDPGAEQLQGDWLTPLEGRTDRSIPRPPATEGAKYGTLRAGCSRTWLRPVGRRSIGWPNV